MIRHIFRFPPSPHSLSLLICFLVLPAESRLFLLSSSSFLFLLHCLLFSTQFPSQVPSFLFHPLISHDFPVNLHSTLTYFSCLISFSLIRFHYLVIRRNSFCRSGICITSRSLQVPSLRQTDVHISEDLSSYNGRALDILI